MERQFWFLWTEDMAKQRSPFKVFRQAMAKNSDITVNPKALIYCLGVDRDTRINTKFQYRLKLELPQGKQTSQKNKGGKQTQKMLEWLWSICAGMRLSQEGFRMTLFSMAWA